MTTKEEQTQGLAKAALILRQAKYTIGILTAGPDAITSRDFPDNITTLGIYDEIAATISRLDDLIERRGVGGK